MWVKASDPKSSLIWANPAFYPEWVTQFTCNRSGLGQVLLRNSENTPEEDDDKCPIGQLRKRHCPRVTSLVKMLAPADSGRDMKEAKF
ncbi:hypothetical protein TELCIR_03289 [Teladorsagia circumcincta]|uniref:Uncharacterized protein n=1 Tax=Teladorsagia circumcincta TaxID=45464 RepID=A0A2G9UYX2_TELCI|nr:hypothetical protein TELCIR_03289 [Teladorsagia circumcincta]